MIICFCCRDDALALFGGRRLGPILWLTETVTNADQLILIIRAKWPAGWLPRTFCLSSAFWLEKKTLRHRFIFSKFYVRRCLQFQLISEPRAIQVDGYLLWTSRNNCLTRRSNVAVSDDFKLDSKRTLWWPLFTILGPAGSERTSAWWAHFLDDVPPSAGGTSLITATYARRLALGFSLKEK